uniref:C-type lectin domain-containing protein n=1 Tax=Maylandia zebra TaxID=106582 RepID=A0A3P9CAN1_9CICH
MISRLDSPTPRILPILLVYLMLGQVRGPVSSFMGCQKKKNVKAAVTSIKGDSSTTDFPNLFKSKSTMDRLFTYILFLLNLSGTFSKSKYIYIEDQKTWNAAQNYCREKYTDLAPVSNEQDLNKLQKMRPSGRVWVGLQRILSTNNWTWSGGGPMEVPWANKQPDNGASDTNGYIDENGLSDGKEADSIAFFCYSPKVVNEKKTWEEALEYCRKTYSDLASVASLCKDLSKAG